MEHEVKILFLSKQEVDSIIDWEDVIGPVEEVFRCDGEGSLILPLKDPIDLEGGNRLMAMAGCLKSRQVAGMKWMRFYPGYAPLPRLWAQVIIISDTVSGLPTAILDGTTITAMRTAGGHAVVAAKYLMRKDSRVLGILGSGAQALAGVKAFDYQFALDDILMCGLDARENENYIRSQFPALRAKFSIVDSVEEVCRASDILLTATSHRGEPIVDFNWLKRGCFIDSMTSFHEIGPDAAKRVDKWFLGHRKTDSAHIIHQGLFRGQVSEDDVCGTLGEVVCGKLVGRESDDEIILYTHGGMGALDIAVAQSVCNKAHATGVGTILQLT